MTNEQCYALADVIRQSNSDPKNAFGEPKPFGTDAVYELCDFCVAQNPEMDPNLWLD